MLSNHNNAFKEVDFDLRMRSVKELNIFSKNFFTLYAVQLILILGVFVFSLSLADAQDSWLGISSSNLDSSCGDLPSRTLSGALDGTDDWGHFVNENHWFILDLGESYTIKKARARSNFFHDPTNVNVYVSDDKNNFGAAVASGINAWRDTSDWAEIDTIEKTGRYVRVEIQSTEGLNYIIFGNPSSPFSIFDVFGKPV